MRLQQNSVQMTTMTSPTSASDADPASTIPHHKFRTILSAMCLLASTTRHAPTHTWRTTLITERHPQQERNPYEGIEYFTFTGTFGVKISDRPLLRMKKTYDTLESAMEARDRHLAGVAANPDFKEMENDEDK
jgi:hypothetical protein